jgi:CPA2 family monovalent cation:H+ antiporter-2
MESWDMLLQIILLLTACLLAGSLMAWLKQSPLVGYLLAGMFVGGPGGFAIIKAEQQIESIAELGVALLLFSLGLEFSWKRVIGLGKSTLLCGVAQVVVTLLAAAFICWLFGLPVTSSLAIGAMICLSSTATVLRVLVDRGEMDSASGRNSLAVLLVQDMAVVPLAILIPLLAEGGEPSAIAARISGILLAAFAVVASLYFLLNYVAVKALQSASFGRNRELTVLLSIIVGLGATWAAHAAKLSPALGAFVAGMFLGNSQFAVQIRADVASVRIVLLTLFFGAVGMIADPVWMFKNLPTVLGVAAMILVGKSTIIWVLFRLFGRSSGVSLSTALCLCQVGEFAFVLGSEARGGQLISDTIYSAIVSSSIVTLMVTPWLIAFGPKATAWLTRRRTSAVSSESAESSDHPSCEILVIGFGPAGRGAVSHLQDNRDRVLVLDLSPNGVASAQAQGFRAMIGDASSAEVLEHLHLDHLKIVAITLPSRQDALAILNLIRTIAPHATKIVRSRHQLHTEEFVGAGADFVVGDEEQVSRAMSNIVQQQLGKEVRQENERTGN